MTSTTYLLFAIFVLFCLWAVIAFSVHILKPLQTRWAVLQARKIVAEGKVKNDWQFRNIYRMLATSKDDLEAAKLWHELDRMK
jgi:quinol-cytochrome oxidoreductase complex cytochrome b subunit